ncbi:10790_t:CDS:2 [Dentiscutata erythropus]|uniref:10790_t:CDS:1 n=1 Tax=Dentiscutata erythropus TaxID=1348616 RepID=A0A9N9CGY0_9GLOM|nr:10790_t:CDS:2 [Dentiscutata erythropus]
MDYAKNFPLSSEFFSFLTLLKNSCNGDLLEITFKDMGIIITRDIHKCFKGHKKRKRLQNHTIKEMYVDISGESVYNEMQAKIREQDGTIKMLRDEIEKVKHNKIMEVFVERSVQSFSSLKLFNNDYSVLVVDNNESWNDSMI